MTQPNQVTGSSVAQSMKADTDYVVLRSDGRVWLVAGEFTARSAVEAAKQAYEKLDESRAPETPAAPATFVAVPARSWKPTRIVPKTETKTTLVVEEVRDDG